MNGERNYWLNAGVALAIGLVLSSIIFGWFYSKTRKGDEAITVTGSAKRRISSDLVVWSAGVSSQAPALTDAYRQLSDNIPRIKEYLLSKGIPENQMTVSSISSTTLKARDEDGNETGEITGYALSQQIEVRSNDVQRIAGRTDTAAGTDDDVVVRLQPQLSGRRRLVVGSGRGERLQNRRAHGDVAEARACRTALARRIDGDVAAEVELRIDEVHADT